MKKIDKLDEFFDTSELRDELCDELFIDQLPTEWIEGAEGRETLNLAILAASKKLFEEGALIYPVLKLNFTKENISVIIDIKRNKAENALTKVMVWALEKEKYEICQEIKKLSESYNLKLEIP